MDEPALPAWFLFLNFRPGSRTRLDPVPQPHAALGIAQNCFNYGTLGLTGFEALTRAVDHARCGRFDYGDLRDAIDFFHSPAFWEDIDRGGPPPVARREEVSHG